MYISDYSRNSLDLFKLGVKVLTTHQFYSYNLFYKEIYFNDLIFLCKALNSSVYSDLLHSSLPDFRYTRIARLIFEKIKTNRAIFTLRTLTASVPLIYVKKYNTKGVNPALKPYVNGPGSADFIVIEDISLGVGNYRKRKRKAIKMIVPYAKKYVFDYYSENVSIV